MILQSSKQVYRLAVLFLCGVLILIVVAYMIRNLVNVPFEDDWGVGAVIAMHAADGTLTFETLLAPSAEHRLFFAKAITALSTLLTNWDTRFDAWFNLIFALAYFGLLLKLQHFINPNLTLGLATLFALLIFSLKQHHNWLIGLLISYWVAAFLLCLGLWLLISKPIHWRTLALTAVCAFTATFSLGNGMLFWAVLLPAIWLRGYRDWRHYALWIVFGALAVGLYFYQNPALDFQHLNVRIESPTIADYGGFLLSYLGLPFVFVTAWELFVEIAQVLAIIGLIGAVFCGVYLWHKNDRLALIVPSALILFSLFSNVMTAVGRVRLGGASYPLYNLRYITIANLFWIGLLMLGAAVLWHLLKSPYRVVAIILSSVLLGGYGTLLLQANFDIILRNVRMKITEDVRACVLNYTTAIRDNRECLSLSAPYPDFLYTVIREVAKRRLTVFADWQTDFPPAQQPAFAHVQPILGDDYQPFWLAESSEDVRLSQHPPSTAEQHLQLPNTPQVFFEAEIYVDLTNVREHPDVPQTGAEFRLSIREGRRIQTLYEGSFDVNVERAPLPIRVDLSPWRGRAIVLVYETLVRQENPSYAWAMWRNPRLVTQ
mgnify:CR=1 FL=1